MNYFKPQEFECKCGCGLNCIQQILVAMLNTARDIAKVPFIIASGCRCNTHNFNVGGSQTSAHIEGWAVDIEAVTDYRRSRILRGLIKAGFTRIGIDKDFVHADIDPDKNKNRVWVY